MTLSDDSPDPFALIADPGGYLARPATERALAAMVAALGSATAPVVLTGPAGIGKTMLLRVLGERERARGKTPLYLPYPHLEADELWRWGLAALGVGSGQDPEQEFVSEIERRAAGGAPVLVLIDDAGALPRATASHLAARIGPSLGVVVAATEPAAEDLPADWEREAGGRSAHPFASEAAVVALREAMTQAEVAAYLRHRLRRAGTAADLAERFDEATVARLAIESCGNPVLLHQLAGPVLRASEPEPTPAETEDAGDDAPTHVREWSDRELARAASASRAPGRFEGAGRADGLDEEGTSEATEATDRNGPGGASRSWIGVAGAIALLLGVGAAARLLDGGAEPTPEVPQAIARAMRPAAAEPEPEPVPLPEPELAPEPALAPQPEPELAPAPVPAPQPEPAPVSEPEPVLPPESTPAASAELEEAVGPALAGERPPADIAVGAEFGFVLPVSVDAPRGAVVEVDGDVVGRGRLRSLLLEPGQHHFVARLADGSIVVRDFAISIDNLKVSLKD